MSHSESLTRFRALTGHRYQEVMSAQINYLASVWFRSDAQSAVGLGERIDEKVDSYANGESNHAAEAMVLLWELSREGPPPTRLQEECTPGSATLTQVIPLILGSFRH